MAPILKDVHIQKKNGGSPLGAQVHHGANFIHIRGIYESGFLHQHNVKNPKDAIPQGSKIYEINGVRNSTKAMLKELKQSTNIHFRVELPPNYEQPPQTNSDHESPIHAVTSTLPEKLPEKPTSSPIAEPPSRDTGDHANKKRSRSADLSSAGKDQPCAAAAEVPPAFLSGMDVSKISSMTVTKTRKDRKDSESSSSSSISSLTRSRKLKATPTQTTTAARRESSSSSSSSSSSRSASPDAGTAIADDHTTTDARQDAKKQSATGTSVGEEHVTKKKSKKNDEKEVADNAEAATKKTEEDERQQKMEEDERRQKMEEDARRQKMEEDARRQKMEDDERRQKMEENERRQKMEEEKERRKMEEDVRRKKLEEEERKKMEEDERRKSMEEEEERKTLEEKKRSWEEEAKRKKAEEKVQTTKKTAQRRRLCDGEQKADATKKKADDNKANEPQGPAKEASVEDCKKGKKVVAEKHEAAKKTGSIDRMNASEKKDAKKKTADLAKVKKKEKAGTAAKKNATEAALEEVNESSMKDAEGEDGAQHAGAQTTTGDEVVVDTERILGSTTEVADDNLRRDTTTSAEDVHTRDEEAAVLQKVARTRKTDAAKSKPQRGSNAERRKDYEEEEEYDEEEAEEEEEEYEDEEDYEEGEDYEEEEEYDDEEYATGNLRHHRTASEEPVERVCSGERKRGVKRAYADSGSSSDSISLDSTGKRLKDISDALTSLWALVQQGGLSRDYYDEVTSSTLTHFRHTLDPR